MTALQVVPTEPQPEPLPEGFDAFWVLYARHEAKKDARKAWAALTPDQQILAIEGAARWRKNYLAREQQYRPLPATFLRGERWEDEPPDDDSRPASSAHVAFANSGQQPKATEIPEHVKALLRKLTGRA